MKTALRLSIAYLLLFASCHKDAKPGSDNVFNPIGKAYRDTVAISYQGISVDVVIDKPRSNEVDVMLAYHGTVIFDSLIMQAANNALDGFKRILDDTAGTMIISVAYPEEKLLMGDNLAHAEAALLWLKANGEKALGIRIKRIFLAGHSQGGYLVTRLATLHSCDGVVANGPGPLNLVYRCQLEENGQIPKGITCNQLRSTYGTTTANPDAYMQRSLLNFTGGFKSDILFVQGLDDTPIQMYSWPSFKKDVQSCTNCQSRDFLELPGFGHTALFDSKEARTVFNEFLRSR